MVRPMDFLYDALHFKIERLPQIQHASVVNLQHSFETHKFLIEENKG
jgi:hypothetical protein